MQHAERRVEIELGIDQVLQRQASKRGEQDAGQRLGEVGIALLRQHGRDAGPSTFDQCTRAGLQGWIAHARANNSKRKR